MNISKILLYDEPAVPEIQISNLARFIEDTLGIKTYIRKSFFSHFKSEKDTAIKLAATRILDPYMPFENHTPTEEEVDLEEKMVKDNFTENNIILYDGFELQKVMLDMIPEEELSSDIFHIVFSTRLSCTYDLEDSRYHGRAVICSNPALVSTTGIIEAPAKPRAYYLIMQHSIAQGLNVESLKEKFRGKFLEYHDKNLGQVAKGYVLQAIFYYITSEPFCDSKECMLHNAHWQEELIHSQIKSGKLCERHQKILKSIRKHE